MDKNDFNATIEEDLTWRRREIYALFKLLDDSKSEDEQRSLRRAIIAILYAHWEGFVKSSAQNYLLYVRDNASTFRDLSSNFLWIMSEKSTSLFFNVKLPIDEQVFTAESMLLQYEGLDRSLFENRIDTSSNLKEKVFRKICYVIGLVIDDTKYDLKVICEELLSRRNKIAHGTAIPTNDFKIENYRDSVMNAMNNFLYDLMSLVDTNAHLREAA